MKVAESAKGKVLFTLGKENEFVTLELDLNNRVMIYDRANSLTPGAICSRKVKLDFDQNFMDVRLIIDTCSIEVFAGEGKIAFTNTFFFENEVSDCNIKNETEESLNYVCWDLIK